MGSREVLVALVGVVVGCGGAVDDGGRAGRGAGADGRAEDPAFGAVATGGPSAGGVTGTGGASAGGVTGTGGTDDGCSSGCGCGLHHLPSGACRPICAPADPAVCFVSADRPCPPDWAHASDPRVVCSTPGVTLSRCGPYRRYTFTTFSQGFSADAIAYYDALGALVAFEQRSSLAYFGCDAFVPGFETPYESDCVVLPVACPADAGVADADPPGD